MYRPCPFCNAPVDLPPELIEARRGMTDLERIVFDFLWRRSPGGVIPIELMEYIPHQRQGPVTLRTLKTMVSRIRSKLPEGFRVEVKYKVGWRFVSDQYDRRKMLK